MSTTVSWDSLCQWDQTFPGMTSLMLSNQDNVKKVYKEFLSDHLMFTRIYCLIDRWSKTGRDEWKPLLSLKCSCCCPLCWFTVFSSPRVLMTKITLRYFAPGQLLPIFLSQTLCLLNNKVCLSNFFQKFIREWEGLLNQIWLTDKICTVSVQYELCVFSRNIVGNETAVL